MFKTLVEAFKVKEVRKKLLFTLLLLLIYRIGCYLPVPGISTSVLKEGVSDNTFLGLLNSLSGGALSMGAFLALGISPYITSSIIVQLLAVAIPSLERLSKDGENGKRKISLITKIVALVLAVAQATGTVIGLGAADSVTGILAGAPVWLTYTFVILMLVCGSMLTVWLGEKITSIGIGNGVSLLIFVGLLSSACTALMSTFKDIFSADKATSTTAIWQLVLFLVALLIIFAAIVFVDGAERKVNVSYAKQMKGRKMYGGSSSCIPIRVNANGVMPIIFASSILTFPQVLFSIFWPSKTTGFIGWWSKWLGAGSWVYSIVLAVLILFFSFFYNMISFNTDDIAKQIQQNGGFIQGIRPGKPTSQYLSNISKKITLFGAIFLALVALVPTLIFKGIGTSGLVNAFSATGLLIVVSVALEFNKSLEAQLLMRNYRGFLK